MEHEKDIIIEVIGGGLRILVRDKVGPAGLGIVPICSTSCAEANSHANHTNPKSVLAALAGRGGSELSAAEKEQDRRRHQ